MLTNKGSVNIYLLKRHTPFIHQIFIDGLLYARCWSTVVNKQILQNHGPHGAIRKYQLHNLAIDIVTWL